MAAGRATKKASSNNKVKSKTRQAMLTRGPNLSSASTGQLLVHGDVGAAMSSNPPIARADQQSRGWRLTWYPEKMVQDGDCN